jgi:hypothetical protein
MAMYKQFPTIALLTVFIIISGFSCKHKKVPQSDSDFPADSVKKWNEASLKVNQVNEACAAKNPYHFTDSARKKEKPEGIYRIAVLGDSFIWGDGVPYNEVWSHKLERKLINMFSNVEVMSWGLCGWSTMTEYDFFVNEGYKYNIDLLIIAFVENDPDMGKPRTQGQSEIDWQLSLYEDTNLKEYGALLKKVATIPEQFKTKLLFVITPLCVFKDYEKRRDKLIPLLNDADITYLDLSPAHKKKFNDMDCRDLFATPVNGHPGDQLNDFYADEVINYLSQSRYTGILNKR